MKSVAFRGPPVVAALAAVIAAAALVVLAGSLARPAEAAVPGLARVGVTTASNSDDQKGVFAYCPTGKKVVGAGGEIVGGQGEVLLSQAIPGRTLTNVYVRGVEDENGFAGNWSATAYAICADPLPGLEWISANTYPDNSTNPKFVGAACPAGKQLLGTGFAIDGAGSREVGVSHANPNQALTAVHVGAHEFGGFGTLATWSLYAYGICADPLPGLQRVSVTSASNSLGTKSITATCPSPKKATGVGAELGGLATRGSIEDFKPNGSPPPSATATGYEHGSFSGDWTITSHAICAFA